MTLDPNTIIADIISTVCAGIILAAIIGLFVRIIQLLVKRVYFPIKISFDASAVYGPWSGSYAVVPSDSLHKYEGKNKYLHSLKWTNSSYICPIPFVISFTNISDKKNPRNCHLKEVEIILKGYKTEEIYLESKSLIMAEKTCHAGGRGSEATFKIYFPFKDHLSLPLFRLSKAQNPELRIGLDLPADSYSEVCFWMFPSSSGRYVFEIFVDIEELGHIRRIKIAQNVALLKLNTFDWVKELYFVNDLWHYPSSQKDIINNEYKEGIKQSLDEFIKLFHKELKAMPDKKQIKIFVDIIDYNNG